MARHYGDKAGHPKRAEIVRLFVSEGLTGGQIAARMDEDPRNITAHLSEARRRGELSAAVEQEQRLSFVLQRRVQYPRLQRRKLFFVPQKMDRLMVMHPSEAKSVSIEELREALRYDASTGRLCWRSRNNARWRGDGQAGWLNKRTGYYCLLFRRKRFLVHRVAWALTHGYWPPNDLDHVNGNPSDNRLANLREATRSQNMANAKRLKNNTSGFKGVYPTPSGRWRAVVVREGRAVYAGTFDTPAEAHTGYVSLATSLFGQFARAA